MSASILIVDDEENLRLTLSRILNKAGYNITTASSGEEALNLTQAGAFELAFIDLLMPGMGGLALLKEFRKLYPEMPVLILTANATLDSAIEAVRQGARDYLLKPADPQLGESIRVGCRAQDPQRGRWRSRRCDCRAARAHARGAAVLGRPIAIDNSYVYSVFFF